MKKIFMVMFNMLTYSMLFVSAGVLKSAFWMFGFNLLPFENLPWSAQTLFAVWIVISPNFIASLCRIFGVQMQKFGKWFDKLVHDISTFEKFMAKELEKQ